MTPGRNSLLTGWVDLVTLSLMSALYTATDNTWQRQSVDWTSGPGDIVTDVCSLHCNWWHLTKTVCWLDEWTWWHCHWCLLSTLQLMTPDRDSLLTGWVDLVTLSLMSALYTATDNTWQRQSVDWMSGRGDTFTDVCSLHCNWWHLTETVSGLDEWTWWHCHWCLLSTLPLITPDRDSLLTGWVDLVTLSLMSALYPATDNTWQRQSVDWMSGPGDIVTDVCSLPCHW